MVDGAVYNLVEKQYLVSNGNRMVLNVKIVEFSEILYTSTTSCATVLK